MSRFARLLLVVVLVGFGVRVAYVALAKSGPCVLSVQGHPVGSSPSECTTGDQIFYNAEANRVAAGGGFVEPLWSITHPGEKAPPAADHPPLTVMVLAPVSWIADHPPVSWFVHERLHDHVREHRYTMVVLGTVLVLLVGLLGRRIGGDTVGLVAAAVAALSPNIWVNDGLVMSETVTGLTVVGAMLLALDLRDRPSWWRAALLGLVSGVAALARVELVLFVVLLVVVVALTRRLAVRQRLELVAAGVLAAALVIVPWVGFNLARFDQPTFISTNDGIALLGSNCDPVYSGPAIGLTDVAGPDDCLQVPPPPGDQSDVAKVYRSRAFHYMRAHASRVPLVVLARVARTWSLYRPSDMVWFNVGEGRERWVTRLGLVAYYPTLVAAVVGALVLWRRRARMALYVLVVPAIAVTAGVAATYGQTRFRAAAEPSLAILAATGVVAFFSRSASSATPRRGRPAATATR